MIFDLLLVLAGFIWDKDRNISEVVSVGIQPVHQMLAMSQPQFAESADPRDLGDQNVIILSDRRDSFSQEGTLCPQNSPLLFCHLATWHLAIRRFSH